MPGNLQAYRTGLPKLFQVITVCYVGTTMYSHSTWLDHHTVYIFDKNGSCAQKDPVQVAI